MRRPTLWSVNDRHPVGVGVRTWVALGLLVVGGVLVVLRPWSPEPVLSWDAISTGVSGLAALGCFWTAPTTRGALRRSWALFGTTLAMWTVADLLWYAYGTAEGVRPVLSAADALYLVGLVPATLGLVLYPVGTWEPGARARLLLDVVVLGGALLLISELLVLGEVVARVGVGWDAFVYVVYPVTDVLLAALAMLLLLRSSGTPRVDLALIALAFATWTAADNGYALLSARGQDYVGTPVEVAYAVAPALLGLAALCARREAARVRTLRRHASGRLALLLPDLASLAALSTCVVTGLHGRTEWVLAATVLALTGGAPVRPHHRQRATPHGARAAGREPHRGPRAARRTSPAHPGLGGRGDLWRRPSPPDLLRQPGRGHAAGLATRGPRWARTPAGPCAPRNTRSA